MLNKKRKLFLIRDKEICSFFLKTALKTASFDDYFIKIMFTFFFFEKFALKSAFFSENVLGIS